MKKFKIIDSIIQIVIVILFLVLLKTESLKLSVMFTYLFLGPYQLFSQFIHYVYYEGKKLRKAYTIGVLVFFLGLIFFLILSEQFSLHNNIYDSVGMVFFFLSTSLAILYIFITFTETYEEIGK